RYAMLGLSVSVSAGQIATWLLHGDPRAILNAGRWSALGLAAGTPLVLLWLLLSGRTSIAVMLAAFVLPVFVEGARRWGGLLRLPGIFQYQRRPIAAPGPIHPRLAEQCATLLKIYL